MKIIETPIYNAEFHLKYSDNIYRAIKAETIEEAFEIAKEFCKQKDATLLSISKYNDSKILELSTKTITVNI